MENTEFNSDVETGTSSEPQESAPEQTQEVSEDTGSTEEASAKQEQANTPFHEHPRFKELVEQKNRYAEQARALEERYAQMEKRLQGMESTKTAAQQEKDALIERLKGIDPEFGKRFESLDGGLRELNEIKEWRAQMEQRAFIQDAVSVVKDLHSKNNITPELQARYNNELDLAHRSGLIKSTADVEKVYKSIHEEYNKLLDSVRRAERESYVSGKKQDASKPTSQPKGTPVKAGKDEFSKDPAIARSELISRVLKQSKAERDV